MFVTIWKCNNSTACMNWVNYVTEAINYDRVSYIVQERTDIKKIPKNKIVKREAIKN